MIAKSGDRDFDLALAHNLATTSDIFGVLPGFAFFDDSAFRPTGNALATELKRTNRSDGTVLFGKLMLQNMLALKESPEAAVAAVCAHEFGHILQFKEKLFDRINSRLVPKRGELQADFFAGYFAGKRRLQKANFPAAVVALTMNNLGDTQVDSDYHHGTHEERGEAVVQGFDAAYRKKLSLADAIQVSTSYVRGLK